MKRVFSLMLFRRCCGGDGQVEAVVLCVALTEQSFPRFEPPWFVLRPDRTEMERGGGRASLGARVFRFVGLWAGLICWVSNMYRLCKTFGL